MKKYRKVLNALFFILLIGAALYASFLLAEYIATDPSSRELIQDYGYFGILLVSFVAGLNLFIPIPAAAFVPIFTAAGISLIEIILLLIVGTMAANLLSFYLGRFGGNITKNNYPHIQKKLTGLYSRHKKWVPYFVFAFSATIPLPDEVFLIPLGIVGVKLRHIIIPLILGTAVYQTIAALGVENLFRWLG
jgi:membrane protein YqaA with SNARE-associated domain